MPVWESRWTRTALCERDGGDSLGCWGARNRTCAGRHILAHGNDTSRQLEDVADSGLRTACLTLSRSQLCRVGARALSVTSRCHSSRWACDAVSALWARLPRARTAAADMLGERRPRDKVGVGCMHVARNMTRNTASSRSAMMMAGKEPGSWQSQDRNRAAGNRRMN